MSHTEKTLIVELNEFNPDILRRAATQFGLPTLERILSFRRSRTAADSNIEHHGLDPWVQWVSIHTGKPSSEHNVFQLGGVDKLRFRQIWEKLGERGSSTGIWGAMNAKRNKAPRNLFFVPDPWNFTEAPFPPKLGNFFALPIYYAKNYMDFSYAKIMWLAVTAAWSALWTVGPRALFSDAVFFLRHTLGAKLGTGFLVAAFELVSARFFIEYRRAFKPDVCFLFLNCIAHFQHHEWTASDRLTRSEGLVFRILDRTLALVFATCSADEKVLVVNAFTQKNVADEQLYCYRQVNPEKFLRRVGLAPIRVEQCMTNDGHAFFGSRAERDRAAEQLDASNVNGAKAFDVERDVTDATKLFYRFSYWGPAGKQTMLSVGDVTLPLLNVFAVHARRTGAHVPEGAVYAKGIDLPEAFSNFKVFRHVWPDLFRD